MNVTEFAQAVLKDGGVFWEGWTAEELSHAIRETSWGGESGFQAQNGFWSWQYFPSSGWQVQAGRGVTGAGRTLEEAHAEETAAYQKACEFR